MRIAVRFIRVGVVLSICFCCNGYAYEPPECSIESMVLDAAREVSYQDYVDTGTVPLSSSGYNDSVASCPIYQPLPVVMQSSPALPPLVCVPNPVTQADLGRTRISYSGRDYGTLGDTLRQSRNLYDSPWSISSGSIPSLGISVDPLGGGIHNRLLASPQQLTLPDNTNVTLSIDQFNGRAVVDTMQYRQHGHEITYNPASGIADITRYGGRQIGAYESTRGICNVYEDFDHDKLINPGFTKSAVIQGLNFIDKYSLGQFRQMDFYAIGGIGGTQRIGSIRPVEDRPFLWRGVSGSGLADHLAVMPVFLNTDNLCTVFDIDRKFIQPDADGRIIVPFKDEGQWQQWNPVLYSDHIDRSPRDLVFSEDYFRTKFISPVQPTAGTYYNGRAAQFSRITDNPFDINRTNIDLPVMYMQTAAKKEWIVRKNQMFTPEVHSGKMHLAIDNQGDLKGYIKIEDQEALFRRYSERRNYFFIGNVDSGWGSSADSDYPGPNTIASVMRQDGIDTFSTNTLSSYPGQLVFNFKETKGWQPTVDLNYNSARLLIMLPPHQ